MHIELLDLGALVGDAADLGLIEILGERDQIGAHHVAHRLVGLGEEQVAERRHAQPHEAEGLLEDLQRRAEEVPVHEFVDLALQVQAQAAETTKPA